jgi:hypothetical protein
MQLRFLDWVFLTDSRSIWQSEPLTPEESRVREEVVEKVQEALKSLPPTERRVIEMYHFDGQSFSAIARSLGKSTTYVTNMRRRAMRSLRKHLAQYARDRFGIEMRESNCCICNSGHREEIDELIAAKRHEEPYSVLIRTVRRRFGLLIKSPQTIKGHAKYH